MLFIKNSTCYSFKTKIFVNLRDNFSPGPGFEPGSPVREPALKAGDPGTNLGPGDNFFATFIHYFFIISWCDCAQAARLSPSRLWRRTRMQASWAICCQSTNCSRRSRTLTSSVCWEPAPLRGHRSTSSLSSQNMALCGEHNSKIIKLNFKN